MTDRVRPRISGLEEKHLLSILLFLAANGPSRKTAVYSEVSTNPRMPEKFDILVDLGLVEYLEDDTRWSLVSLTPKGIKIAAHLQAIDILLAASD